MIDVATETSNGIIAEYETQMDLLHVRNEYEKYIKYYKIQIFLIIYYIITILIGAKIYRRR